MRLLVNLLSIYVDKKRKTMWMVTYFFEKILKAKYLILSEFGLSVIRTRQKKLRLKFLMSKW